MGRRVRFNAHQHCREGRCSLGCDCPCEALDNLICDEHDPRLMESIHLGCFCTWEFMCVTTPLVDLDKSS